MLRSPRRRSRRATEDATMAQRSVTPDCLAAAELEARARERALAAAEALVPFAAAVAAALARERMRRLAAWNRACARLIALRRAPPPPAALPAPHAPRARGETGAAAIAAGAHR